MTMRDSLHCPKCKHGEIIHVPSVRDSGYNRLLVDQRLGFMHSEEFGEFEVYICRGCGFAEMYVKGAANLPIDRIAGARLLVAPARPPYR